jgi:hypothetical protein
LALLVTGHCSPPLNPQLGRALQSPNRAARPFPYPALTTSKLPLSQAAAATCCELRAAAYATTKEALGALGAGAAAALGPAVAAAALRDLHMLLLSHAARRVATAAAAAAGSDATAANGGAAPPAKKCDSSSCRALQFRRDKAAVCRLGHGRLGAFAVFGGRATWFILSHHAQGGMVAGGGVDT